jgi:hypothetical protein
LPKNRGASRLKSLNIPLFRGRGTRNFSEPT